MFLSLDMIIPRTARAAAGLAGELAAGLAAKFAGMRAGRILLPVALVILGGAAVHLPAAPVFAVPGGEMAAGEEMVIGEIEFKDARILDAIRIISEMSGENIVATDKAGKKLVTLFVRNLGVADIIDSMCRISGLWYRHNSETGVYILMTTEEYEDDIVVFRNEVTRKFQLKYLNVGIAARTIYDLYGEDRVHLQGLANELFGSDYRVSATYNEFAEDFRVLGGDRKGDGRKDDEGEGSNEDDSADLVKEDLKLTPTQIKELGDSLVVSETQVREVDQHAEAPIYVSINRLHNMLFVRTSDEKAMREIERIIADSDLQVPEVLLEMKVLEVQLTDQFQSAFDISNIGGTRQTGPDDGGVANPMNVTAGSVGSVLLGTGSGKMLGDSTLVFQALSGNVRARLQLLEEEGNISSLATPMLLAANNHPAKLFIGEETVITKGFKARSIRISGTGTTYVTGYHPVPVTRVEEVGNTLTILPSINADRSVVLRIIHENSSVKPDGGRVPLFTGSRTEYVSIDTVNISTLRGTALAQDGMTIAVGGMMRTSRSKKESKVPLLGDIPLVGFFFKNQSEVETKTETILLITPHVLSAPAQGEVVTRHRVGELVDHGGELNAYFESLDTSRSAMEQDYMARAMEKDAPLAASVVETSAREMSFVELTRTAVGQVRKPYLFRKPEGRIIPVQLRDPGDVKLFNNPYLVCRAAGAWTDGYHFVTAVRVENHSPYRIELDLNGLYGEWEAATLEQNMLNPEDSEGNFTYIYLISEEKFSKNMEVE